MMRIGVLTGGGDCPGLNAALRAVVKRATRDQHAVLGIRNGWKGLVDAEIEPLTEASVIGILPKGGTILGTSRTNPMKREESAQRLFANFRKAGLDALIAIGGEDTLGVARDLHQRGLPIVGVPKTIDNDLAGTDVTFGFDTAVSVATEAIDRLHTTAEAHRRVMVVEVMGRKTGWIAVAAGIAGGADCILIPEHPFSMDEIGGYIRRRHERGKHFSIVVVAEGAAPSDFQPAVRDAAQVDEFGHARLGGIGTLVGGEIERRLAVETRVTILGHIQRGGTPTAFDRILATRFGIAAVELVEKGEFGRMAAIRGSEMTTVPLEEATRELRRVDPRLFAVAETFFG